MDEDIKLACEVLRGGGIILYPTDTVWGIGCDASNGEAVKRIFSIKQRADNKAMIILLGDECGLERYVDGVPDIAYDLISLSDKPLTIVYDKGKNLAPELLGADGSVGVRITREEFSCRLCKAFKKPIVSTSANVSGMPTPVVFAEISDEIKSKMDYIATSRREDRQPHEPSSVIRLGSDGTVKILRS